MIKKDLYDNSVNDFVVLEPKKQQAVFFPKEESQMFIGKESNYVSADTSLMSDNQDLDSFANRALGGYLPLNSSQTATDYIGAINMQVPFSLQDSFVDINFYDVQRDVFQTLFDDTDTTQKIKSIVNGLQTLRLPSNVFNTLITTTDIDAIMANGGSPYINNYGYYYIFIKSKFIQSTISNVIPRTHISWEDLASNNDGTGTPINKRRTIYECDKADFENTPWLLENSPEQSGRLFGSVVEVWDTTLTTLKQIKIMNENVFNFSVADEMQFVLTPDNMGYDSPTQEISNGDIIKVYPRETYFNEIVIEINYKDKYLQIENMISFMLNDVARDTQTGAYQIYDDAGLTVEPTGLITGNVIHRYQISQTDRFELRKRIKS